jgi:hypothetical protein
MGGMTHLNRKLLVVVAALLIATGGSPAGRLVAADGHQDLDGSLMAALEKSRYKLTPDPLALRAGETKHVAVNHAQRLRALFTDRGLELAPLDRAATSWRWMLSFSSYGYDQRLTPVETVGVSTLQNRVEYRHRTVGTAASEIREWYVNRALGIEHGFTLPRPPGQRRKDEFLQLALTISGDLRARPAGNAIEFVAEGGTAAALRYGELHALDATGTELPSRLEVHEKQVRLLVDDSTARYPIVIDPLIYTETTLTAASGDSGDLFGFAVAIDGNTAVIGAPGDEDVTTPDATAGSVYVYVRSGRNWVEQAHLYPDPVLAFGTFGASVAVDGDTLVVGDPEGGNNNGQVFVYVRNRNAWTVQATIGYQLLPSVPYVRLGESVDIDGDTLVIGAPLLSIQPLPNQPNTFGAALVYVRTGDSWNSQAFLVASDASDFDAFGTSVAISGNTIAVGAPGDDFPSGAGSVYVFARNHDNWVEQFHLFASDAAFGDQFGTSVDISGSRIVVGAPFDNTAAGSNAGSAYVYARDGNAWFEEAHLVDSDGADNDRFGSSVAVAGESLVAVGAPFDNTAGGTNAGSVHLFARGVFNWRKQATLTASDGSNGNEFGGSVAVDTSKSKTRVVAGASARNKATGAAYVYEYSTAQAGLK